MSINTTFETVVDIPYGQLKPMIQWCTNNCTGDWHFKVINEAGAESGSYLFQFESETDFVTFTMWKK